MTSNILAMIQKAITKQNRADKRRNHLAWDKDDLRPFKEDRSGHLAWSKDDIVKLKKEDGLNEDAATKIKIPHHDVALGHDFDSSVYHDPIAANKVILSAKAHEHYGKIQRNLSPEHRKAIMDYKGDSEKPNKYLRGENKYPDQPILDRVRTLDHFLSNKKTPEHHVVYRGFNDHSILPTMKRGDVFHDKGFVSTTFDPATAAGFGKKRRTTESDRHIAMIHVPKGHQAHYVDHPAARHKDYGDEEELLLNRGTKFKVLGHSHHQNRAQPMVHVVHLEAIK
jgi:hypothetical protein